MEAELEWWVNECLAVGPFAVLVEEVDRGRLRNVGELADLRLMRELDPAFTLRFGDGSIVGVVVGPPGDDGGFSLEALPADV